MQGTGARFSKSHDAMMETTTRSTLEHRDRDRVENLSRLRHLLRLLARRFEDSEMKDER
jgi:hypothetical protein